MNPYLSGGTKDIYASSMVLEPLAGLDPQGNLVPKLAAEIPTRENGGISEDRDPQQPGGEAQTVSRSRRRCETTVETPSPRIVTP